MDADGFVDVIYLLTDGVILNNFKATFLLIFLLVGCGEDYSNFNQPNYPLNGRYMCDGEFKGLYIFKDNNTYEQPYISGQRVPCNLNKNSCDFIEHGAYSVDGMTVKISPLNLITRTFEDNIEVQKKIKSIDYGGRWKKLVIYPIPGSDNFNYWYIETNSKNGRRKYDIQERINNGRTPSYCQRD